MSDVVVKIMKAAGVVSDDVHRGSVRLLPCCARCVVVTSMGSTGTGVAGFDDVF